MSLFRDIQTDIAEIQAHYELPMQGAAWEALRNESRGALVIEQLDSAQIDILVELIYVISERFHNKTWTLNIRVANQALKELGYPKAQVKAGDVIDRRLMKQLHMVEDQERYSDWKPQSIAFGDL